MLKTIDAGAAQGGAAPEALIGGIYAAVVDSGSMQALVDLFHRALPGLPILLYGQDTRDPSGNFLLQHGFGRDVERAYMTGLHLDDPYVVRQWAEPVGGIYDEREVRGAMDVSALHRQFLAACPDADGAAGVVVYRDDARQLVLEVRYDRDDTDARREARAMLETAVPHVMRAFTLVRGREAHPFDGAGGDALLDIVPVPAFALDADCAVRSRNEVGARILKRMESVFIGADNVLHARDAAMDADMKAFCAGAGSEFMRPRRKILVSKGASGRIYASLHAVPPPEADRPGGIRGQGGGWRTILVIDDAARPLRVDMDALGKALALTHSEAELAMALLQGDTLGDCAANRSSSKQSMRNLLLSLMRKTETHRQTQLVSLLTRLSLHAHT
jgi:DNA-binding HTH domain-containing proteins